MDTRLMRPIKLARVIKAPNRTGWQVQRAQLRVESMNDTSHSSTGNIKSPAREGDVLTFLESEREDRRL
ncbi:small ribosomal subunit protein eS28-like [Meriones unguiculatus]|uniref:small ribosomal subunit protein eS28-like n=1 Tax=Meriones unguiculatus TaxID=10047 RepID=UPI00293E6416|nr:small ribosomal subunit protein eS28-like [Meriones unguiculatus]